MAKLIFVFFLLSSNIVLAQVADSLLINIKYGTTNPDLRFYMMANGIDLFKIKITNDTKEESKLKIVKKEISEGKLITVDTVYSWKNDESLIIEPSDSLKFLVLTSHITDNSLRFNFEFEDGTSFSNSSSKLKSEEYSLRDAIESHGADKKISNKGAFPFLVYSLPYIDPKNPNVSWYCKITGEGISIDNWYEHYGIKHYIIFDLIIE